MLTAITERRARGRRRAQARRDLRAAREHFAEMADRLQASVDALDRRHEELADALVARLAAQEVGAAVARELKFARRAPRVL